MSAIVDVSTEKVEVDSLDCLGLFWREEKKEAIVDVLRLNLKMEVAPKYDG